ncbi:zinc finger MYM-type protein 1 [Trichonephila clavipes]|nr:zinc finger MYM-type protein 1 [Trichonephila clavipes]
MQNLDYQQPSEKDIVQPENTSNVPAEKCLVNIGFEFEKYVDVVKYLAIRGLAFRGKEEGFGSPHNGNFMGVLELLAEFDPFIREHIEQRALRPKSLISYLSKTIFVGLQRKEKVDLDSVRAIIDYYLDDVDETFSKESCSFLVQFITEASSSSNLFIEPSDFVKPAASWKVEYKVPLIANNKIRCVKLAFTMTVKKSQGQSFKKVGLCITSKETIFNHGLCDSVKMQKGRRNKNPVQFVGKGCDVLRVFSLTSPLGSLVARINGNSFPTKSKKREVKRCKQLTCVVAVDDYRSSSFKIQVLRVVDKHIGDRLEVKRKATYHCR